MWDKNINLSFNNLQMIFLLSLTLIYAKPLIWVPKSCATIINKTISKLLYYSLWKITITFQTFYQHHLWIHHWPALHPSFYQTLAFALWLSVIVENYQVKFPFSEVNQLKSIPWDITTKNYFACSVMWFVKIQLDSQGYVIL